MEDDLSKFQSNGISIPVTWAMFGGSTFILFLLCYFCQKKLQIEDSAPLSGYQSPLTEVYVIPTAERQVQSGNTHSSLPSPPPEYNSVAKEKKPAFQYDTDPPSYESVVNGFPQPIFVEEEPSKLEKHENNPTVS